MRAPDEVITKFRAGPEIPNIEIDNPGDVVCSEALRDQSQRRPCSVWMLDAPEQDQNASPPYRDLVADNIDCRQNNASR